MLLLYFALVLQQELDLKSSVCSDLEGKLNETTTQLEDRASTLAKYEENLEVSFWFLAIPFRLYNCITFKSYFQLISRSFLLLLTP